MGAMSSVRPSPIFVAIAAALGGLGWWMAQAGRTNAFAVFAFVTLGWVLSLIFHEFAHAAVAYIGGDKSVASKGYLTLDPTKYFNLTMSLVMPLIFLVIGGIGLPGGAVWINKGAIQSPAMRSFVSLAGPLSNVAIGILCLLPIGLGVINFDDQFSLTVALSFLGLLQFGAVFLNMIPIPGFDGYGTIEPFLSREARKAMAPLGQYGFLIVFAGLFLYAPAGRAFWDAVSAVANFFGGDTEVGPGGDPAIAQVLRSIGYREFQFWSNR